MAPPDDNTIKRNIQDLLTNSKTLTANFVVLAGADIGRKYEINKEELSIGRDETCDVFINDDDISRNHAQVQVKKDGIYIEDLGSTNGTLVNGQKVKHHMLSDGDRIQLGNLTVLKFNFLDDLEDTFNEQLYNAANRDFLTQIYNKKYFLDRLKMEFSYSRRHEVDLSLIVFDIDLFKKVNDAYGHSAGDHILKELALQIEAIKREEDLFARFGGEEFVLLLRDTSLDSVSQIAEKLRARVEQVDFEYEGTKMTVTISIGVSTFSDNSYRTYDELFKAADKALYDAKNSGRNNVKIANATREKQATPKL